MKDSFTLYNGFNPIISITGVLLGSSSREYVTKIPFVKLDKEYVILP